MAAVRKRSWTTSKGERRSAWAVDLVDTSGRRERRQFSTKREADAFRIQIEGQLRSGTFRPDASKVTVEEVADLFLENCRGRMQRRERMTRHNLAVYEGHVRNYICASGEVLNSKERRARVTPFASGIAPVKLAQLTASKVADFRDRLREAGVTVATARKVLGTLQVMLQYAVSRDLMAVNPARGIKVIGRRDEGAKRIEPPSKETLRRLIEVADPEFRVRLVFASATGVRAGELHALRWHHVNFKKGELAVEGRVDAYGDEDTTKTAAGLRKVPLGNDVLSALKGWRLQSSYSRPDDLIFPNRDGQYTCHANMVKRRFYPLFDRLADLHAKSPVQHPAPPERFNWHALRHFAISCWIEAGLAPKAVQTFAGHSSLQVTLDRYGHLFPSADHKVAMDGIAKDLFG